MDLVTFLLVKVIGGILYVFYWLTWQTARVVWWLTIYLLVSAGAGVAWLARGGRAPEVDSSRFGRYLEGRTRWQDDASGTVYPAAAADREYCEIHAELTGQYWRRTAIARLLRRGAIWRYRFYAADGPSDGRGAIAAWCDFPQEARKNITLDHLDPELSGLPELAGVDQYAMAANREEAFAARKHVEWLLSQRGWEPAERSADPSNAHWYADRYSRPVISWRDPVATELPAPPMADLGTTPESRQQ